VTEAAGFPSRAGSAAASKEVSLAKLACPGKLAPVHKPGYVDSPTSTICPLPNKKGRGTVLDRSVAKEIMPNPPLSKPNLVFAGAKTIRIGFNAQEWREWFVESQQPADPWGVVACFRNPTTSGSTMMDANEVRALLIYHNQDAHEMGIAPRACWLQDYSDMTDIPAGEMRCAILVIRKPSGEMVAPWRRRAQHADSSGHDVFTTEAYTLAPGVSSIELRLSGESNQPLLAPLTFDLTLVDGEPPAVRGPR